MKNFLKKLYGYVELLGYSRAAHQLASMGYLAEAKELMLQRSAAKQTIEELSALSDKELADIGITRGEIYNIAHQRPA